MLIAGGFGLLAGAIAIGVGTGTLASRGIGVQLDGEDYVLLLAGCIVSAALWAAIGVGVGAVVRNQVPTAVGISVWLLFVEQVLLGDILGDVGWFMPGALAKAAGGLGSDPAVAPVPAMLLLGLYALAAAVAGRAATNRRDVA